MRLPFILSGKGGIVKLQYDFQVKGPCAGPALLAMPVR